eukprot:TRINITY_DN42006_c0_g1_i1.p1 TRINITY_DN42006_c0_g1~~TRINITY_DN42006_c0_g1_i1.p1  ORF type:complete len:517 (+),score=99.34 TRINITY_DN42006_c0_g1_i1:79-1551(+)
MVLWGCPRHLYPLLIFACCLSVGRLGEDGRDAFAFPVERHWKKVYAGKSAHAPRASAFPVRATTEDEVKLSSMTQSTVNLVKNIAGAGMLSLPAGVAAFSGSPKAIVPSMLFTLLAGLFSAYGFVLIADACNATGESTYRTVWAKSVDKRTSFLPAMACLAKAAIGCISFSMILGDCISLMLTPLGLPAAVGSRNAVMLYITSAVLLPLCCMKSLAPLAKFSVLGVLSNVYICFFIALRCLDGAYRTGGALLSAAPAVPKFVAASGGPWSTVMNPGVAVLLSILATAFLAHYNAPMFYEQLAPCPKTGAKDRRFFIVSVLGFGISGLIFSLVMAGGFLTFGSNSMGLILNNYAATDSLALLARGAIVLSLVTAYPLVFLSLKKQVAECLGDQGSSLLAERPKLLTVTLLTGVTMVALRLRNLGKVAAFAGACFGSFLIYVAPALMVLGAQRRGLAKTPTGMSGAAARAMQLLLVPLGLGLGILGAIQSLK